MIWGTNSQWCIDCSLQITTEYRVYWHVIPAMYNRSMRDNSSMALGLYLYKESEQMYIETIICMNCTLP